MYSRFLPGQQQRDRVRLLSVPSIPEPGPAFFIFLGVFYVGDRRQQQRSRPRRDSYHAYYNGGAVVNVVKSFRAAR